MRITWLMERADQLWGGVKVALENANWLADQGHEVTVLSRSGPPAWMALRCRFVQVQDFRPEHLPAGDVLVGTFWTTVPWAASAGPGKGVPVHFCQGYEGDMPEHQALRDRIEATYRLPGVRHVTIASNVTKLLRERFGLAPREVPYVIDHAVHFPAAERPANSPLRIGLVGPYQVAWKDLATGYAACRLLQAAGQDLVLVRATNTAIDPAERNQPFAVEWHERVPPARMGDYYRSLDVLLATSSGAEEGFFLPAVEAMACGVPTVLTDVPCFRSHEQPGNPNPYALLVPPGDAGAMAEALLVAGRVAEVRTALRREGLNVAGRYTQAQHGNALLAAFHEFVAAAAENTTLRLVPNSATPPDIAGLCQQLQTVAADKFAHGDHATAARLWQAACCLQPDDDALLRRSAEALQLAGDHFAALQACDQLLARGHEDEALHTARGHALHALGQMGEAAQAFRAALAVGVRTADAYNRLGVVLFQAGDVAAARASFERALVLQPGHGDAAANLHALPAA